MQAAENEPSETAVRKMTHRERGVHAVNDKQLA